VRILKLNFKIFRAFILLAFLLPGYCSKASKIEKGFEALRVYDYFKAKKIFYEVNQKKPDAYASYGLSVIFNRNDNPFSNSDSAVKYINLSYNIFRSKRVPLKLQGFPIDSLSILKLADSISYKELQKIKKENNVEAYNKFLSTHYLAKKKWVREAFYLRDELEFNRVVEVNVSDTTYAFILTHPESIFLSEAKLLKDRQLYSELTKSQTAKEYISFLRRFPRNMMANTAYEKLFTIYSFDKDVKGLGFFVSNYPSAPQVTEAWKLLFSLTVKEYSYSELKRFLEDYPAFPLKNTILRELELNKLVLYPYKGEEFSGFIDENGKFVIPLQYDETNDFHEGLSIVSRNDSVFFINKENINPFGLVFDEASRFKNGIAPVKKDNKWFFINRQGQIISEAYDEINELSNSVYVVKEDGEYGALDHFGQQVLEPKFEKLGDFKNGFAYFTSEGKYGFVSKTGTMHKAEFDWISDFDENHTAIVKMNNKYGIINAGGKEILRPAYDLILKTGFDVYIVIAGNSYGFFSAAGCFFSSVSYDYLKEKPVEFYTDSVVFKLLKEGKQSFIDRNGKTHINFGAYQEINFVSDGLMRVKQKNKYGFIDKRLNVVIPYKYQEAGDFKDSIAIVKLKESNILLDPSGTEVYSTVYPIEKISKHYYLVNDNARVIISHLGEPVYTGIESIQKINKGLLIITLNNKEIKLLYD
jgi:hypothetical protein